MAASDDRVAISVRNVGKMYRIYDRPEDRLKQMLWRGRRMYGREFWALRDVSFDVKRGETVGIIGRNGSGKSTLLQMIAGTLAPTEGEVHINGRVAALLELGSGFNLEFTGRENVFMNGAILGFSHGEMEARFDEIAAFADIGDFIEQPVKLYSSGMMLRLAFAVQACIEPDVLIVDEALTVGDLFFQQKCYRRLEALRSNGTSVLLVTHGMGDIRQFCQQAILLSHGQSIYQGPPTDAIARYMLLQQSETVVELDDPPSPEVTDLNHTQSEQALFSWPTAREAFFDLTDVPQISNGWARCTGVALCASDGQPSRMFQQGETASIFYEFELLHDIDVPIGGFNIENEKSVLVHGKNATQYDSPITIRKARQGARLRFCHDVTLDIAVGEYTFEVGLASLPAYIYEHRNRYTSPELYTNVTRLCHLNPVGRFVVTPLLNRRTAQMRHFGLAHLAGGYQFSYEAQPGKAPDSVDTTTASCLTT